MNYERGELNLFLSPYLSRRKLCPIHPIHENPKTPLGEPHNLCLEERMTAVGAQRFLMEHWRDGIQILVIALVFYAAWRYIRRVRGARLLAEALLVIAALAWLSKIFDLQELSWLIRTSAVFFLVSLIIIFQPELRRAVVDLERLTPLGRKRERDDLADEVAEIVRQLSGKRHGALLALPRRHDLKDVLETGVQIDAELSPELVMTIFHPKTALHDGGMVLKNGRIQAAACLFPVCQRELMDRSLGLRHRAALGLTETTDAIVVIVSEETGTISISCDGELERGLAPDECAARLRELLAEDPDAEGDEGEAEATPDAASSSTAVHRLVDIIPSPSQTVPSDPTHERSAA
jgi:diadenylate cyclase